MAALPAVADRLEKELAAQGQEKLLREVEIPLAAVLADMETHGFEVDRRELRSSARRWTRGLPTLQREITAQVGYEFNLNSPKQSRRRCLRIWGCPRGRRPRQGTPQTPRCWRS